MKKFTMLLFSLIIFAITIALYFNENQLKEIPAYKFPSIKYSSSKYKNIRNISPMPYSDSHTLIVLCDDDHNKGCSNINLLNIDTGKVTSCRGLELNKNFDDKIFFRNFNNDTFSLVSNHGLLLCSTSNNIKNGNNELILSVNNHFIDDLSNVTDIVFDSYLYYIKKNDPLIHYEDTISSAPQIGINYNNNAEKVLSYCNKPYSLVASNYLDEIIYYTKHEKNGLNLYLFSPKGYRSDFTSKPIVQNFVYGNPIQGGDGVCGIYEKGDNFNLFFKRRSDKNVEIDTISKNTDMLGQIPDLHMITYNADYIIAYSSFDENHMGKIFIKTHDVDSPKVVIQDEPIVGPIKIYEYRNNDKWCYKILFSTLEDNNIKFKFYDIDNKKLEDITHLFN